MTDSLRKIFECYIIPLIKKSITYRNKVYKPLDKIIISPTIFRKIICNKNCGACCLKLKKSMCFRVALTEDTKEK